MKSDFGIGKTMKGIYVNNVGISKSIGFSRCTNNVPIVMSKERIAFVHNQGAGNGFTPK